MRKCQLGALGVHGLCDTPGYGAVRGEAYDQRAFAAQETHGDSLQALTPFPGAHAPNSTGSKRPRPILLALLAVRVDVHDEMLSGSDLMMLVQAVPGFELRD